MSGVTSPMMVGPAPQLDEAGAGPNCYPVLSAQIRECQQRVKYSKVQWLLDCVLPKVFLVSVVIKGDSSMLVLPKT